MTNSTHAILCVSVGGFRDWGAIYSFEPRIDESCFKNVCFKNGMFDGKFGEKCTPVSLFQEEEMPEVEIDIDDLLEVNSEDERAVKLQASV